MQNNKRLNLLAFDLFHCPFKNERLYSSQMKNMMVKATYYMIAMIF